MGGEYITYVDNLGTKAISHFVSKGSFIPKAVSSSGDPHLLLTWEVSLRAGIQLLCRVLIAREPFSSVGFCSNGTFCVLRTRQSINNNINNNNKNIGALVLQSIYHRISLFPVCIIIPAEDASSPGWLSGQQAEIKNLAQIHKPRQVQQMTHQAQQGHLLLRHQT